MSRLNLLVIGLLALLARTGRADVQLSHLSTIYLPAAKEQKPAFAEGAVEQIAYDPVKKFIYAVGKEVLHAVNASDPDNLQAVYTKYETNVDFTDIERCGDYVFTTVHDPTAPLNGTLRVYRGYNAAQTPPMELVREFQVGSLPDMLNVLEDCQTVVVAVEGEAFDDNGNLVDPEGGVTIVHFPHGLDMPDHATVTPLDFNAFDDRYDELKPTGVRFVYRGNNNRLSNDLEPEYVAVDEENNKAYVCLQENNAFAEVDLTTRNITAIRGLGYKQWGHLDASDKDGGPRITFWPIRAWYLPDTIKIHEWQGRKLIFSANEGDSKEYAGFDETTRGASISQADVGPNINKFVKAALMDENALGRLTFAANDGKDETDKYSALYTYGGRSFSIWDVTPGHSAMNSEIPQLFDSGSQFEELTALHCPHLFNTNGDAVDGRSDNKGPESESVTVGEINGRLYIFIGNERPGTIFVYSIGRDVSKARFETIFCEGIPDSNKTVEQMFPDREIYAVDPEDLRFYPASKSPTGRPVLMVAGTLSGTVTLLDVQVSGDSIDDEPQDQVPNDQNQNPVSCRNSGVIKGGSLIFMSICLLLHLW